MSCLLLSVCAVVDVFVAAAAAAAVVVVVLEAVDECLAFFAAFLLAFSDFGSTYASIVK